MYLRLLDFSEPQLYSDWFFLAIIVEKVDKTQRASVSVHDEGDHDGGHSGGGCGLDAEEGVFKDEAVVGRNAEILGGEEKAIGGGLGVLIVSGGDDGVEFVEQADCGEGTDDRISAAAGGDGEGDAAVLRGDVLYDFRNDFEAGKLREVEGFLARGEGFDGHIEGIDLVELGDDFADRLAAPGVEELFREIAVPFRECGFPCAVVERHGIDDGAVAVEDVGAKVAGGDFKLHLSFLLQIECGMIVADSSTSLRAGEKRSRSFDFAALRMTLCFLLWQGDSPLLV
jgi:hypothetical protein